MTENDWPKSLTRAQGKAIRHYRELAGLKHEELARKLTEAGLPMQRTTLVNIEQGLRKSLSVPEILAIGYVLDVPPGMLIAPLGLQPKVEAVSGQEIDTWRALGWISGELKFGEGLHPSSTSERTIGQEIRSHYSAIQELVEDLVTSRHVLEVSDNPVYLAEARRRAAAQSELLSQHLDILSKKDMALPQLPHQIEDDGTDADFAWYFNE